MKFLYVVDIHAEEKSIEWVESKADKYDALIVGGDLCTFADVDFMERFLRKVGKKGKAVFFVPGNNDPPDTAMPEGVVNIHGKNEKFGETRIGGLGGSNKTPFNTRFEISDDEAREILDKLGKVDILVSHCPPFGTKCDIHSGKHLGSLPVREYIQKNRPAIVLTGHVHESRAVDKIGDTTIVNPGPMFSGNYAEVQVGDIYIVELKSEKI
jgi:Icc-related predicted phosphoesterase